MTRVKTKVQEKVPAIVVVGCPDDVVATVRKWMQSAVPAQVKGCPVNEASTTVAKWRPFALMVADHLYEFDPDEFRALARDVGAKLFPIPTEIETLEGLEDLLTPDLSAAFMAFEG